MWPFKRKSKDVHEIKDEIRLPADGTVADGIRWQEIISEGRSIELFDGCRAKCDGTFEDL